MLSMSRRLRLVLFSSPMRLVRIALAALLAMTTISCSSSEYELRGSFTLQSSSVGGSSSNCRGTGGYDDIKSGLSVTVRDGSGSILGTGRLGDGRKPGSSWCTFEFSVGGLSEADFYSVEVGSRGEMTYSFEEMENYDWEVAFTLG